MLLLTLNLQPLAEVGAVSSSQSQGSAGAGAVTAAKSFYGQWAGEPKPLHTPIAAPAPQAITGGIETGQQASAYALGTVTPRKRKKAIAPVDRQKVRVLIAKAISGAIESGQSGDMTVGGMVDNRKPQNEKRARMLAALLMD